MYSGTHSCHHRPAIFCMYLHVTRTRAPRRRGSELARCRYQASDHHRLLVTYSVPFSRLLSCETLFIVSSPVVIYLNSVLQNATMLCDVCKDSLEGMCDPLRTKRLDLLESVPFFSNDTRSKKSPGSEAERYVFGHHETRDSFLRSKVVGCLL